MNDLISRQDVIDLWDKYHPYIATKAIEYDRELRALPSAQPERKKGEWIEDGYYNLPAVCCYCGEVGKRFWNFCPSCGTDMRKEANDE